MGISAILTGTGRSARPPADVKNAYQSLLDATEAGLAAARPGATAADVFRRWTRSSAQAMPGDWDMAWGCNLPSGPRSSATDLTHLEAGMVLTLEPASRSARAGSLVHEENIVVTEGAPRMISPAAPREIPAL